MCPFSWASEFAKRRTVQNPLSRWHAVAASCSASGRSLFAGGYPARRLATARLPIFMTAWIRSSCAALGVTLPDSHL